MEKRKYGQLNTRCVCKGEYIEDQLIIVGIQGIEGIFCNEFILELWKVVDCQLFFIEDYLRQNDLESLYGIEGKV